MSARQALQIDDRAPESAVTAPTEGRDRFRSLLDNQPHRRTRAQTNWALEHSIARAADALVLMQQVDGHWVFELEADATMPALFILLQHYLGTIETDLDSVSLPSSPDPRR